MNRSYMVAIDWPDGSGEEFITDDYECVRERLDDLRDQPVRIWVDGQIVQRGFAASDERSEA